MRFICLLAALLTLSGCITTYRDFPADAVGKRPQTGNCDVLYYNVKRFDVLDSGGYSRLQAIFRDAGICKKMVAAEAPPEKGLYLEVTTKWQPMSMPALIFGYISVATLTLLPAWSTQDGYFVEYAVYVDGQKKDTYKYDIRRTAGLWLGLLPFAWVNLLTYSEEDAFSATAYQVTSDARKYFTSPTL